MKKELLFVIGIGIIIGSIVVFGVYIAQNAIKQQNQEKIEKSSEEQTTLYEEKPHTLTITEPLDEIIVDSETIQVSGKTTPEAIIAIIAEENELLLTADKQGDFTTDVTLVGGANQITVSAFNNEGQKAEQILTVVYSTAQL